MMTKRYEQTDKLQVCFTKIQADFLTKEKELTGDTKSDIVRRAVQNLMIEKLSERLDWEESGICSCGGTILKKDEGLFITTRCSKCKMGINILKHTIKPKAIRLNEFLLEKLVICNKIDQCKRDKLVCCIHSKPHKFIEGGCNVEGGDHCLFYARCEEIKEEKHE